MKVTPIFCSVRVPRDPDLDREYQLLLVVAANLAYRKAIDENVGHAVIENTT